MFFDLGLVVLGGAMGAATAAALGSLCYGGYVAFSAAASGKVGLTAMAAAGGKAFGAYIVGAAAHLAPHVGVGLAVDFGKGQIYSRMPKINTSDAVTDGVKIFRSLYLIESKHEIETEGKRLEAEAKKGIKVVENDI